MVQPQLLDTLELVPEAPQTRMSLGELEDIVAYNLGGFVAAGLALAEIRDRRLYKKTHPTFEAYCAEHWGLGRSRAYQLMDAAEVTQEMSTIVDKPATEAQARELAKIDEPAERDDLWQQARAAYGEQPTAKQIAETRQRRDQSVHYSSATPEWTTPEAILDRVVEVMGGIDLDPCAEPACAVPAAQHYTEDDNGLARDWLPRTYMNPPYGDEIAAWIDKLLAEFAAGHVEEAIALVPARTDTQWFVRLWNESTHVCFLTGRLKFSGHDNSAPFPSALAYLGDRYVRFTHVMHDLGIVAMDACPWDQEENE